MVRQNSFKAFLLRSIPCQENFVNISTISKDKSVYDDSVVCSVYSRARTQWSTLLFTFLSIKEKYVTCELIDSIY